MKLFIALFTLLLAMGSASTAEAGRAAHFRGIYDIVTERGTLDEVEKPYFLIDNDSLGVLWGKYADGPLPPDLEQYRNEQSVIAGFSHRSLLFFGLERGVLIGNEYMAMEGGTGQKFELRRRPDGQYDMVAKDMVRVGGSDHPITTVFLLAAPRALPNSR